MNYGRKSGQKKFHLLRVGFIHLVAATSVDAVVVGLLG